MKIRRRTLGTVYTKSPVQHLNDWVVTNVSKVIFAFVYGVVWMGVFYIITGIIRFLWAELMKNPEWQQVTVWQVYTDPKFVWANMIGFFIVIVYCMRDSLTRR